MTEWTEEAIVRRQEERLRDRMKENNHVIQTQREEQFVQASGKVRPTAVMVQDVQMPFGSMVGFMVKWALASVPALLILFVIGEICWLSLIAIGGIGASHSR